MSRIVTSAYVKITLFSPPNSCPHVRYFQIFHTGLVFAHCSRKNNHSEFCRQDEDGDKQDQIDAEGRAHTVESCLIEKKQFNWHISSIYFDRHDKHQLPAPDKNDVSETNTSATTDWLENSNNPSSWVIQSDDRAMSTWKLSQLWRNWTLLHIWIISAPRKWLN